MQKTSDAGGADKYGNPVPATATGPPAPGRTRSALNRSPPAEDELARQQASRLNWFSLA